VGKIRRHWKALIVSAAVLAAALVIGGPWIYIHLVEGKQPKALSLSDVPTVSSTSGSAAGGRSTTGVSTVPGTWTVTSGSTAGLPRA
jgi:hypothetical protein